MRSPRCISIYNINTGDNRNIYHKYHIKCFMLTYIKKIFSSENVSINLTNFKTLNDRFSKTNRSINKSFTRHV